jgi:hypothetical protein
MKVFLAHVGDNDGISQRTWVYAKEPTDEQILERISQEFFGQDKFFGQEEKDLEWLMDNYSFDIEETTLIDE